MYELPPILNGSAESQLRALRDYLVRLSQTLPTETTQPAAGRQHQAIIRACAP